MNTIHFLERLNLAKIGTRRRLITAFLNDGVISPDERSILDEVGTQDEDLAEYRARQVAAQSFERNGFTRLTRDRFRDAGYELVAIADARRDRHSNVVPIRENLHA